MNILVRVDAYAEIALGHLSRCIELGKALSKLNNKVVFLTYEDCASKPKLDEFGLDYKLIPYKINDVEDIDAEIKALEKLRIRPEHYLVRLVGEKSYKFRVGNYRIIIDLNKNQLSVLVIKIGHRKNIYK